MFLDSLSPPLVVVVFLVVVIIAVVTVILIDVAAAVVVVVEALTLAGAKISFLFPFSVSDLFLSFFEEKSLKRPSGQ